MGINTMNRMNAMNTTNTMMTTAIMISLLDDDDEFQSLKEEFKDVFEESDVQKILESEVAALEKTNSPRLKTNRSKYIKYLI